MVSQGDDFWKMFLIQRDWFDSGFLSASASGAEFHTFSQCFSFRH